MRLRILLNRISSLKVFKIETNTLSKPYSSCIDANLVGTELALEMRQIGMRYRRRDCMKLCEQKITIERYNCYLVSYPKIYNVPPCPYPFKIRFNMSDCIRQCPHECNLTSYDLSISYGEYPSQLSMNNLINSNRKQFEWAFQVNRKVDNSTTAPRFSSLELARASLVKIFVYFDEIKYTKISEAPTTTCVELIANIGGTLGLFIGISLLSFVEVIELFVDVISIVFVKFKRNQSSD